MVRFPWPNSWLALSHPSFLLVFLYCISGAESWDNPAPLSLSGHCHHGCMQAPLFIFSFSSGCPQPFPSPVAPTLYVRFLSPKRRVCILSTRCYFPCACVWFLYLLLCPKAHSFPALLTSYCFWNLFMSLWVGQLVTSHCCIEFYIPLNHFPRHRHPYCLFSPQHSLLSQTSLNMSLLYTVQEFLRNLPPQEWVTGS